MQCFVKEFYERQLNYLNYLLLHVAMNSFLCTVFIIFLKYSKNKPRKQFSFSAYTAKKIIHNLVNKKCILFIVVHYCEEGFFHVVVENYRYICISIDKYFFKYF